jgi:hypothetical protein
LPVDRHTAFAMTIYTTLVMTKNKMATRLKASRHDNLFYRDSRLLGFEETRCARSCQIANKFASAATLACWVLHQCKTSS